MVVLGNATNVVGGVVENFTIVEVSGIPTFGIVEEEVIVEDCVIVEEDDPVVVTGGGPILAGGAVIAIVVVDVVFGGGGAVFFGVIVLGAEIVQDSGGIFLCVVERAFDGIVVVVVLVREMSIRWCSVRGTIVTPAE